MTLRNRQSRTRNFRKESRGKTKKRIRDGRKTISRLPPAPHLPLTQTRQHRLRSLRRAFVWIYRCPAAEAVHYCLDPGAVGGRRAEVVSDAGSPDFVAEGFGCGSGSGTGT